MSGVFICLTPAAEGLRFICDTFFGTHHVAASLEAAEMNAFIEGFWRGAGEAWRGYLAPLRPSLWRAAITEARAPGATWQSLFVALGREYNRIVTGGNIILSLQKMENQ